MSGNNGNIKRNGSNISEESLLFRELLLLLLVLSLACSEALCLFVAQPSLNEQTQTRGRHVVRSRAEV